MDDAQIQRQHGELRRVSRAVAAMPEYQLAVDEHGWGPLIWMVCPNGHRLVQVRSWLVVTHPTRDTTAHCLTLEAVPTRYPKSGRAPIVSPADIDTFDLRPPCRIPGCAQPSAVSVGQNPRLNLCAQHGGRPVATLGSLRTKVACAKCSFDQPVLTSRLLGLYGVALRLGRAEMSLGVLI